MLKNFQDHLWNTIQHVVVGLPNKLLGSNIAAKAMVGDLYWMAIDGLSAPRCFHIALLSPDMGGSPAMWGANELSEEMMRREASCPSEVADKVQWQSQELREALTHKAT